MLSYFLSFSPWTVIGDVLVCSTAYTLASFWPLIRKYLIPSPLRNVAGPPRQSLLEGNLGQLFSPQGWDFHRDMARKYGGAVKIHGLCGDEQLYVSDPKALYHIVLKDQDVFEETEYFTKSNLVCFGAGMLSVVGDQHRKQRKMMNPVFNINHIRSLTPIFYRITNDLRDVLLNKLAQIPSGAFIEVDMMHWMKRTALEYIGQCGLGYTFGEIGDDSTNEYSDSVKNFTTVIFRLSILRQFVPFLSRIGPTWFRRLVVCITPIKRVQRLREICDVMYKTATTIFNQKKERLALGDEAVKLQVGEGRDIMSILMKENMKAEHKDRLPDGELLGQMSTLIFAAQDTTSTALSRILHMLAEHPDAQARLREEVSEARILAKGDVAYDELHALPYLDAIVRETLRLFPPVYMIHRTTQRDVTLPLSSPVLAADGKTQLNTISLLRNTNVIIAIEAANRRIDVWGPDASEWKPERWTKFKEHEKCETEPKLPGVYTNTMTFLGGGRSCIGFKFALLEIKVVLSVLLERFQFDLCPDKKYAWKLGGICTPGIEDDPVPKLPMRVSLVKSS